MADIKLGWGKPTVQIKKAGASTAWVTLPTAVENSVKLNGSAGTRLEAKLEGGAFADVKYNKNTYTLELELYKGAGFTAPIEDVDGVVLDNYSVRVIPENKEVPGITIEKTAVSATHTFDSQIGMKVKYQFDVLTPDNDGPMITYGKITDTNAASLD